MITNIAFCGTISAGRKNGAERRDGHPAGRLRKSGAKKPRAEIYPPGGFELHEPLIRRRLYKHFRNKSRLPSSWRTNRL